MAAAAAPYITRTSRGGSSSLHHADITRITRTSRHSVITRQRRTAAPYIGDNGESTSLTVKGSSYAQDNCCADEGCHCGVCDFSE
ncbi:hypothetical protein STEG23_037351 [Scotinomys teguina]